MVERKRTTITRGIIAVWMAAMTACAAPAPDTEEVDRQAVEGEIGEFAAGFWEAWRDGNAGLDRAMAFFDDHPDFSYAAQGTAWRSVADVTDTFRSAFAVVQSQSIDIRETSITVVDRDFAYLMQRGSYSMTDMDGVTSEARPFAFTGLLVRTGSGWKIRGVHVSEPCLP